MTRRHVALLTLFLVLSGGAWYSFDLLQQGRHRAERALLGLGDAQRSAQQIERLARQPRFAVEQERVAAEMTGLIERTAKASGIAPGNLFRIVPQAPQRLGETAYVERPTQIILRNVSLPQAAGLLYGVCEAETGLRTRSLRLVAPRPDDPENLWNVEAVVGYLVYDPQRP